MLMVLGGEHDPFECSVCSTMALKNVKLREEARQEFLQTGVWPLTFSHRKSKTSGKSTVTVVSRTKSLPAKSPGPSTSYSNPNEAVASVPSEASDKRVSLEVLVLLVLLLYRRQMYH